MCLSDYSPNHQAIARRHIAKNEQKLRALVLIDDDGEQFPPFDLFGARFCAAMKATKNKALQAVIELLSKKITIIYLC